MRVVVFGQTGPYAHIALRHLISHGRGFELVGGVEGRSRPVGRNTHKEVKAAVAPLPAGERFSELVSAAGAPCLITCDVNHQKTVTWVESLEADWLICVGFDRLFRPELLAATKFGGLNAHPSQLPEFRGPSPIFWALKRGDRQLSVSVHQLDAKEDHGAIWSHRRFDIPALAEGDRLYEICGQVAGELLAEVLPKLGVARPAAQIHKNASRAPRPKAEDTYFEAKEWPGEKLLNYVSAAAFFRAAWTRLGDEVFFVRRGLRWVPKRQLPGQFLLEESTLWLQCADGVVALEVQV